MEYHIRLRKKRFNNTPKGINALLKLLTDFEKAYKEEGVQKLIVDFNGIQEIHNVPMIILRKKLEEYKGLKCQKELLGPKNKVVLDLVKKKFFHGLVENPKDETVEDMIPINLDTFARERTNEMITEKTKQITLKFLDTKNNPYHDELHIHILELVNNAIDHSKSIEDAKYLCTKSSSGTLEFCFSDNGQGIRASFLQNPMFKKKFIDMSDTQAIQESVQFKVSCNPEKARIPTYETGNAGIGLYFCSQFMLLHPASEMIIVSNNGYLSFDKNGTIRGKQLKYRVPGTIVYFKTNLNNSLNIEYNELTKEYEYENNKSHITIS